ncbi:MAG: stage II sporulation protein M [Anaerolineales bacterium]|nr:stage II sporulation protein M [Anaerolineales bacterium]
MLPAAAFIHQRQAEWRRLEALLSQAEAPLRGLSPADVRELGLRYRAAASDLALAQRDYPDQPLTQYLNRLVARGHALLYRSEPIATRRLWRYLTHGLPQTYRRLWAFVALAGALMFGPALLAGALVAAQPDLARVLLPVGSQDVIPIVEEGELWTDIPMEERPYASGFIMRNNIQVSILAFGGGVLMGLLTLYVLVTNGLMLGGILGLTHHYGLAGGLWDFIIAHGVVELSVICIASAAGLRLGWAVLQPGLARRRDALALAARDALKLLLPCVPLLVLAGLIEGFISPNAEIPFAVKLAVGLGTGALLHGYLLLAGREPKGADTRA